MPYRVLHILDHSIPLQSGYSFRSLSIFNAQRSLGWETFHLTSAKHYGTRELEEKIDGLLFYRTQPDALHRIPVLTQWGVVRSLRRRIKEIAGRHGIQLIHAHSPCLNGLAALHAGRELGIPVVYELRALWEDAAVDHGTTREGSLRYRVSRALETRVLRHADHVTCICEGLRSEVIARGIDPVRVTVVPNAVNIDRFPILGQRNPELERELHLVGSPVLGFIGSFYAYEGLDLLVEALPKVHMHIPEARLLLVGGGPQERALRMQAASLGIADKVIFTGRVPHGRVPDYSSLVDIFVFPRKSMRLTELVTPLKPLEAMAQGKPVVASDVGGHKELIQHGRTGLLFNHGSVEDLATRLVQALGAPATMKDVIGNARSFVEKERNWAVSVRNYQAAYELASHSCRG